jgi:ribosome-binding protein aMBF1 (putative translation factor)
MPVLQVNGKVTSMKCDHCRGAMVCRVGSWGEPDRIVCMACGREPKGEEKIMEEKEMKSCLQCGESFEPRNKRSRFCKKGCNDKWHRNQKKKSAGNIRRKKAVQNPGPNQTLSPKIDDTILLDQQILKAIKKSVANQIIRIIEEAFA